MLHLYLLSYTISEESGEEKSHFPFFSRHNTMAKTFVIDNNKRMKLRNENDLSLVAELMDDWTRQENTAYHQRMQQQREHIHLLQLHVQRLEARNSIYLQRINNMAAVIIDQRELLEDNIDSGLDHVPHISFDADGIPFLQQPDINLLTDEELDDIIDLTTSP